MIIARGQTTIHIAETGEKGDAGESVTGRMLHRDPEFRKGLNGCMVYNNLPDKSSVQLARIEKPVDCPTTSTHCLQITTTGVATPGHGGVYQTIQSRANAVFLQKIVAKIPVDYLLVPASNSLGSGSKDTFITPAAGTGRYETYLRKIVCGTSGTFSTGGHLFLSGGTAPIPEAPIIWLVASCTVYDLTDSEKYDDAISNLGKDKDNIAKSIGYTNYQDMLDKIGPDGNQTIIDGGLIRANIIDVKNLYAENIRTATSGKRVEILGQDKRISVFDDPDVSKNKLSEERVRISGDTVDDFIPADQNTEHITTPVVIGADGPKFVDIDTNQTTEVFSFQKTELLCEFEYNEGDIVHINGINFNHQISVMDLNGQEILAMSKARIYVMKYNDANYRWDVAGFLGELTIQKVHETATYALTPNMQLDNRYGYGRFHLLGYISTSANFMISFPNNKPGRVDLSYKLEIPRTTIDISKNTGTYSALYSNGLVSYWGGGKYFGVLQLANNDFIRAVDDRHGFKLNREKGFLVSTNANTSSPNWNMPMNCVLMGEVKGGGGSAGRVRSSAPALTFGCRRIIAGEYLISLKNSSSGSVSNYFTSNMDYGVLVMPIMGPTTGFGIAHPLGKTSSQFKIHTVAYTMEMMDYDFIFFVIDIRNWTL